ncbi:hypothetical protein C8D87_10486 [Lentzea atacamensis]|uniref:DUF6760 domain-containing protein n=1 Tax=Lentzea atacamensis TaxID=531938 RepID=A0ABX9E767_9PSEU|nr:hypothetical protein C8D87_10486 [Lentzea atacamensis]
MTYAPDRLYSEVAYVAYHFHWSLDSILDLEHTDRLRYVEEIGRINTRISASSGSGSGFGSGFGLGR